MPSAGNDINTIAILSAHHPKNIIMIIRELSKMGIKVCGICDNGPIEVLPEELKVCLSAHFNVDSFSNVSSLHKAIDFFQQQLNYRVDKLESLNESFLAVEAQLRETYNIKGDRMNIVLMRQQKSYMKQIFHQNNIRCALGGIFTSVDEVEQHIKTYPIIAKPNRGVGAIGVCKLNNKQELENYFQAHREQSDPSSSNQCIFEEFVSGDLYTFEAIVDNNGNISFMGATLFSSGVMEMVTSSNNIYIFTLVDIPRELIEMGTRAIKAFELKNKFVHIEFFRRSSDSTFVICEVNFRIPGGPMMELHQSSLLNTNLNIFKLTAQMLLEQQMDTFESTKRCSVAYVGRRINYNYRISNDEAALSFSNNIIRTETIPTEMERVFGRGNAFVLKCDNEEEMKKLISLLHETKPQ